MSGISLRQPAWFEKSIEWDAATVRVPPIPGIYDAPHKYICMNSEWASIIAGVIYRLTYHEVWDGDFDEREDAIEEIERLLADMANPCCPPTLMDVVNNLYETNITNITTIYNDAAQDETVIAPDMVYGDGDDDYRDIIMCVVSQIIVQSMAQTELGRRIDETWVWSGAGAALALIGTALAGVTGGWSLIGGAIAGAILNLAAAAWRDMSSDDLTNSVALQAVACCLSDTLAGSLPTSSEFEAGLDACGFDGGSAEETLRLAVQPLLADLSFYLSFITTLNDLLPVAKTGVLDDACPCGETWYRLYDFSIDEQGWYVNDPNTQWYSAPGGYSAPSGWFGAVNVREISTGHWGRTLYIQFDTAATTNVTRVRVTHSYLNGNWNVGGILSQTIIVPPTGDSWFEPQADGTYTFEWNGDEDVDYVRVFDRCSKHPTEATADSGYARITKIEMWGAGTPP